MNAAIWRLLRSRELFRPDDIVGLLKVTGLLQQL